MNPLAKTLITRGLAVNRRASRSAANGIDWLFKRDTLIQSGRTWFELVQDGDLMAVRYYDLPEEDSVELVDGSTMPIQRKKHAVPLVLVPPLGVTSETFDLMPQRSLVRYMAAMGFKTYLVDWGKPRREHAGLGLADYSYTMLGSALEKIRQHSGSEEVSLMGWCMGGLLALLHQGQVQSPAIRNIITVASPIDLESGRGVLAAAANATQLLDAPARLVRNYTNFRLNTLDPARLGAPPWLTTLAFKLTDPVSSVTTYWDLITGLSDRAFLESYSTTSDYLNHMLMYPGGVVKDLMLTMVAKNQLASGKIPVGDREADLSAIRSNLLAFAGATDNLVAPEVAEKIIDVVASTDKEFRLAPGGHMGVIIGSKAQAAVWEQSAQWLAQRSAAAKAPARKRRVAAGKSAAPAGKRKAVAKSKG